MHASSFQPHEITHLTFDCYGTLIDWEAGILNALEPLFARQGVEVAPTKLLELYVHHEAQLEAGEWRPYREILRGVLERIAADLRISVPAGERDALAASIGYWPTFDDTVASLQRLKRRFKLVIVSNIDDALFAHTARRLEVPFDDVITAEQVRSYKPGEAHFKEALRRMSVPVSRVLHVAQSLYHDHVPAQRLGFATAWVNRPSRLSENGLAPAATAKPNLVVTDLAAIADRLKG